MEMKRIVTISLYLLLLVGLQDRAQGATAGSYKCFLPQGSFDGGQTYTLPVIYHYNPNKTAQSIRRVRIFDSTGASVSDQSFPATGVGSIPVPPNGTIQIGATIPPTPPTVDLASETVQGLQFIVNWSQGLDTAAAPI